MGLTQWQDRDVDRVREGQGRAWVVVLGQGQCSGRIG